jgi:hypothetical protein
VHYTHNFCSLIPILSIIQASFDNPPPSVMDWLLSWCLIPPFVPSLLSSSMKTSSYPLISTHPNSFLTKLKIFSTKSINRLIYVSMANFDPNYMPINATSSPRNKISKNSHNYVSNMETCMVTRVRSFQVGISLRALQLDLRKNLHPIAQPRRLHEVVASEHPYPC